MRFGKILFFAVVLAMLYIAAPSASAQQPLATSAGELQDFGISPINELRTKDYHAPTPTRLPGAPAITTSELSKLVEDPVRQPILIDVRTPVPGKPVEDAQVSIHGSVWWPWGGLAQVGGVNQDGRFAVNLERVTEGDKKRPLVFFCLGNHCWLSYNAALRALNLGYENVYWYRGGWEAWKAGGGRTSLAERAK